MSQKHVFDQSLKVLRQGELNQVSGAYIGQDQDLSQFPRRIWPYINPGHLLNPETLIPSVIAG